MFEHLGLVARIVSRKLPIRAQFFLGFWINYLILLLLFIEYATSAGHHKNMYTYRNEKKDIKHSGKSIHT